MGRESGENRVWLRRNDTRTAFPQSDLEKPQLLIFFDLETGNLTYLMLIALPMLPILLYLLLLQLGKREPVPQEVTKQI